jgi:hypothetical protein
MRGRTYVDVLYRRARRRVFLDAIVGGAVRFDIMK